MIDSCTHLDTLTTLFAPTRKEIASLKQLEALEHHILCFNTRHTIRASVDALCRDGAGLISRERVQRGRLTRQGTTS